MYIKGKDVQQQSFVGLAFHGVSDSNFDVVYFRPFNFRSPDTVRRSHAVQYVSLPRYDWQKLREIYPGKYEHGLANPPDPNEWFHATISVTQNKIEVYMNRDTKPCLVVSPLSGVATGKIGFWVGNNSDGDFANLVVEAANSQR